MGKPVRFRDTHPRANEACKWDDLDYTLKHGQITISPIIYAQNQKGLPITHKVLRNAESKSKVKERPVKRVSELRFIYDRGLYQNLKEVLWPQRFL